MGKPFQTCIGMYILPELGHRKEINMGYVYIPAKKISYGGTRPFKHIEYIVIHYTGNKGDTARNNVDYFAKGNTRQAGAHYFVDQAGSVYQSVALGSVAWSVGGFFTFANGAGKYYNKCTNYNSVSIELCDCATKDPSEKMIKAVKALVAFIKKQCPNAKTIVRHWDVNGKSCPARMTGTNNAKWNKFRKAIQGATTPDKSKFTLSGVNYPTKQKKGKSFGLYGTITSANTMTRVEIGVVDATTKKWTKQKVDAKVAGKKFNITAQADSDIRFGKLKEGKYFYRCWCWDANGSHKVFDKPFEVVK